MNMIGTAVNNNTRIGGPYLSLSFKLICNLNGMPFSRMQNGEIWLLSDLTMFISLAPHTWVPFRQGSLDNTITCVSDLLALNF
jgi:hypothetical protein